MISPKVRASWARCPVSTTQCTFTTCVDGCTLEGVFGDHDRSRLLRQQYASHITRRARQDRWVMGGMVLILISVLGYCAIYYNS